MEWHIIEYDARRYDGLIERNGRRKAGSFLLNLFLKPPPPTKERLE